MTTSKTFRQLTAIALCAFLAACAGGASQTGSGTYTGGSGGYYKVGKPYQIEGEWYYPKEDYSYDETGIASWYGDDFHNKLTANGEIYNKDELTAAHKTLPMPSLARVTNLENGKSIVVRINDRGPFSGARIIDLSQRSAKLLGFEQQGTAKVRVQVLADESKAVADAMRRYGGSESPMESAPVEKVAAYQVPQNDGVVRETIVPLRSTPETRKELMSIKPVPYAVQLPVSGNNQIFVQAGAFSVQDNAQKLQKRLTTLGKTSISQAQVNGSMFYRVRIGPVKTVAQADALISQLRREGVSGARTIID